MIQHINLLSKRRVRRGWAWLAVWALAAAVLVMLGFAVMTELQLHRMRQSEAQVRTSITELQASLAQKRREAGLDDSQAMAQQMTQLRSQVEARRDWAELMQKGELGTPMGHSQMLETLAQVHEEGVWLQGVEIGKVGQSLAISGKSLSAEAMMRYIAQLNEAFKPMGISLSSMDITQDAAAVDTAALRKGPVLKFKLF